MLTRAGMRNGLTHLAATSLPLGRPDLAGTELLPSESDAVPTRKADECDGKGERPGGSRHVGKAAGGRWWSRECVVGVSGLDASPNARRESRVISGQLVR